LLCATSVSSVSLWLMNSEYNHTTETQRTQRLHREIPEQGLFVQSLTAETAQNFLLLFQNPDLVDLCLKLTSPPPITLVACADGVQENAGARSAVDWMHSRFRLAIPDVEDP